jgi:cell wall-associated NlpC family hydrolase
VRTPSLVRAFGVLVAALLFGLLPVTHAQAEPVEELERQMDEIWAKLEPAIEEYNNVHNQLTKNKAKSAELAKKIAPLQLQVDMAMNRVGALASRYYRGGGTSAINAILTSGSPTTLANQLTLLDQIAKIQQKQIASVFDAKQKYAAEKQALDELIAVQAKQDADLAAKKKSIQAELDRLNRLRVQAYGTSTSGGSLRIGACPAVYIGGAAGTHAAKAAIAVKTACAQIGKSYVFGTAGPNTFDCSGLTQYAWAKAGVSLTHYTLDQWREETVVSRSAALPGDLVFFYNDLHHVGIYVGNGLMVHASRPGVPIKMAYIDDGGDSGPEGFRRPK